MKIEQLIDRAIYYSKACFIWLISGEGLMRWIWPRITGSNPGWDPGYDPRYNHRHGLYLELHITYLTTPPWRPGTIRTRA